MDEEKKFLPTEEVLKAKRERLNFIGDVLFSLHSAYFNSFVKFYGEKAYKGTQIEAGFISFQENYEKVHEGMRTDPNFVPNDDVLEKLAKESEVLLKKIQEAQKDLPNEQPASQESSKLAKKPTIN